VPSGLLPDEPGREVGTVLPSPPRYQCPVDAPVSVLGGKWKLVLLFYLLQAPRRHGELRRLVPTITQKMLTQSLRELEADGLVTRSVDAAVPPRVTYAVAASEEDRLTALLSALCDWGLYWCDRTGAEVVALSVGTGDADEVAPHGPR
jgi:DNA-binding HxlR family transcriptional regulator